MFFFFCFTCSINEVIAVEPNNDNAWYALGHIYKDLGNIQKAEEMLLKALDINSTHTGALYRLGLLYRNSQRYQEAVDVLSKLFKLEPEHQNTLILLAMCHTYLQELPLAAEMYEKALKIDPTRTIAWSNLGKCWLDTVTTANSIYKALYFVIYLH